ncbi:MAG TPA: co-chaperone GroES, partial [Nitratifractor sp.]|nr:co-chaperone GroES [Nitratifractor sp.]
MNFQPLANRVLVEREEEVTTTASGIIIPDNAKEKPLQGKVL